MNLGVGSGDDDNNNKGICIVPSSSNSRTQVLDCNKSAVV